MLPHVFILLPSTCFLRQLRFKRWLYDWERALLSGRRCLSMVPISSSSSPHPPKTLARSLTRSLTHSLTHSLTLAWRCQVTEMAKVGLRCIALTTADIPQEDPSRCVNMLFWFVV
jgi:hypothetical protein